MEYAKNYEPKSLKTDNGECNYLVTDEAVFLTEFEANSPSTFLEFFKEVKKHLLDLYFGRKVMVLVDPSNARLLEYFLKRDDFTLDYVAFEYTAKSPNILEELVNK